MLYKHVNNRINSLGNAHFSALQTTYPDTGNEYLVNPDLPLVQDVGKIVMKLIAQPGEKPFIKDLQVNYCEKAGRFRDQPLDTNISDQLYNVVLFFV